MAQDCHVPSSVHWWIGWQLSSVGGVLVSNEGLLSLKNRLIQNYAQIHVYLLKNHFPLNIVHAKFNI